MRRLLITGASGTVGSEVLKNLQSAGSAFSVAAGMHRPGDPSVDLYGAEAVRFDFADPESVRAALGGCHSLFLLRPPQLPDVATYFRPVVELAREQGVRHIVFLSVQGADRNPLIPHHQIEKLVTESGIPYTFLRPAYFMQNFVSTLRADLVHRDEVYLPAGKAKFALVDVRDIGRVAARVLVHPEEFRNRVFDLTSDAHLSFGQMTAILSQELHRPITYTSPHLLAFFLRKRREGLSTSYILVLIMLHYLPRFRRPPPLSDWVERITHVAPHSFTDFVRAYREELRARQ